MNKDNGGPAFPSGTGWNSTGEWIGADGEGMTLRDYFAAHAPTPPGTWRAKNDEAANIIAWRWAYADAMLEARK